MEVAVPAKTRYKNVYFPNTDGKKSLTIAFGRKDDQFFDAVRSLSSSDAASYLVMTT